MSGGATVQTLARQPVNRRRRLFILIDAESRERQRISGSPAESPDWPLGRQRVFDLAPRPPSFNQSNETQPRITVVAEWTKVAARKRLTYLSAHPAPFAAS